MLQSFGFRWPCSERTPQKANPSKVLLGHMVSEVTSWKIAAVNSGKIRSAEAIAKIPVTQGTRSPETRAKAQRES